MYTEMALTARRFALTLAVAGIATLGSVALAPAASAAPSVQNGPDTVSERSGDKGPDAFIVREHGRTAVFFCDLDKPNKHHSKCVDLTGPTRF